MTCLIGIETSDGRALIAGDTCISDSMMRDQIPTKIFSRGDFAFACAGNWRPAVLMRQTMGKIGKPSKDTEGWILRHFVPWYGGALARFREDREEVDGETSAKEHTAESAVMVAVGGQVWLCESYLDPIRSAHGVSAIGSGRIAAMGSLLATPQLPPLERATLALEIASKICHGVAPPFTHVWI